MTISAFSITADGPEQRTLPLMAVARESSAKNVGMREQNLLSLSYGEIVRKDIKSADGLLPESFETYQVVEPGMTVLRFTDLQNDKRSLRSGLVKERGIITSAYVAVEPFGVDSRFFAYLMRAYDASKVFYGMGGGVRQGLSFDSIRRLPIPDLAAAEQRAIADYLDRETLQIDRLVAKQEEFSKLLRERRVAVIDQVVNGVSAPVVQLRRVLTYLTSGSRGWGDYYSDTGARFLRIGNMVRGKLSLQGEVKKVELPDHVREGVRTRLRYGDLLFSITADIGSVAVIDDGDWVDGFVSQHVALSRLDRGRTDPHYVGWVALSTAGQDQLKQGAAGGTKIQLALDDIRGFSVPMPPLEMQRQTAAYLHEQTSRIDALIAKTEQHIALAKERRSALITAAVTGQIDVRTARKAG